MTRLLPTNRRKAACTLSESKTQTIEFVSESPVTAQITTNHQRMATKVMLIKKGETIWSSRTGDTTRESHPEQRLSRRNLREHQPSPQGTNKFVAHTKSGVKQTPRLKKSTKRSSWRGGPSKAVWETASWFCAAEKQFKSWREWASPAKSLSKQAPPTLKPCRSSSTR